MHFANFFLFCSQFRETFQGLFLPSSSSFRRGNSGNTMHQGASSVANRHNDCNYSTVAFNGKSMATNETGV